MASEHDYLTTIINKYITNIKKKEEPQNAEQQKEIIVIDDSDESVDSNTKKRKSEFTESSSKYNNISNYVDKIIEILKEVPGKYKFYKTYETFNFWHEPICIYNVTFQFSFYDVISTDHKIYNKISNMTDELSKQVLTALTRKINSQIRSCKYYRYVKHAEIYYTVFPEKQNPENPHGKPLSKEQIVHHVKPLKPAQPGPHVQVSSPVLLLKQPPPIQTPVQAQPVQEQPVQPPPVQEQPPPVQAQPPPVQAQPPPVQAQPPPVQEQPVQPPSVRAQPPSVRAQPPPVQAQPPVRNANNMGVLDIPNMMSARMLSNVDSGIIKLIEKNRKMARYIEEINRIIIENIPAGELYIRIMDLIAKEFEKIQNQ